jgi:hypothetical protein
LCWVCFGFFLHCLLRFGFAEPKKKRPKQAKEANTLSSLHRLRLWLRSIAFASFRQSMIDDDSEEAKKEAEATEPNEAKESKEYFKSKEAKKH